MKKAKNKKSKCSSSSPKRAKSVELPQESKHEYCEEDIAIKEITEMAQRTLIKLKESWNELHDMTEESKLNKLKLFVDYTQEFFQELMDAQEIRKSQLLQQISNMKEELQNLEKELNVKINHNITGMEPLAILQQKFEESLSTFRKIRDERMNKFQEFGKEEKRLCEKLGMEIPELTTNFPTLEDIENIEKRIFNLTKEQFMREQTLIEIREKIKYHLQFLERQPESEFEKCIFDVNFQVTESNMIKIKDWELCLNQEVENAKDKKMDLMKKLSYIWDCIRIDKEDRINFLNSNLGYTEKIFENISNEIERCEKMKNASIKPSIIFARRELEELWDLCKFGEAQRALFPGYTAKAFTDDVLQLYQIEIELLKNYYKNNLHIFELVDLWDGLQEKMIFLKDISKDKSRLFNNRGGVLLKEERERKLLLKQLPTVYTELTTLLEKYHSDNQKPFLWNGANLLERIYFEWSEAMELECAKSNERWNVPSRSSCSTKFCEFPSLKSPNVVLIQKKTSNEKDKKTWKRRPSPQRKKTPEKRVKVTRGIPIKLCASKYKDSNNDFKT